MKAIYRLAARPGWAVSSERNPMPVVVPAQVPVKEVEVSWETDADGGNSITAAVLTVLGAPLRRNASGAISADYPDYEAAMFAVASYVAAFVLVETGMDAICPGDLLSRRPVVEPETEVERRATDENALSGTATGTASARALVSQTFDPSECSRGAGHEVAWAHFAVGLRSDTPFNKFEEFYKVLEHFFPGKDGERLDRAVSACAQPLDSQFTPKTVEGFRKIRIRITHPHPDPKIGPHLSPHSLDDIKEVANAVPRLQSLARLFLFLQ